MELDTMPQAGAAMLVAGGAAAATTIANRGGMAKFTRVRRVAGGLVLATLAAAAAPARAADLVVLYNFTYNATGAGAMNLNRPTAGLTIDASGNLYGTASYNGATNSGGVFRLARQADGSYAAPTALATFAGAGSGPRLPNYNPVTLDAQGNIYGATTYGGASNVGSVYEIAAGTGTATTLASFAYSTATGSAGYYPRGAEVRAADGTLWGTTQSGGGGSAGTVYKVTPGATQATLVATFGQNGLSGANPYSGLVADAQGNLYGSTYYTSSSAGSGTLFKVDATAGTVTTLATFTGGAGGYAPFGTLAVDGQGNLFGTTNSGGTSTFGTVFELAAGSSTITTLASFDGTTTGQNARGVIVDAAGNLFGTTLSGNGSANGGTVWELAAGSGTLTTLASFAGSGTGPRTQYGGLVADASGNLYGASYAGGTNNLGTVFTLANTGYVAAAVPEPASWAMLIVGVGAVGGTLRRRKISLRVSCAA